MKILKNLIYYLVLFFLQLKYFNSLNVAVNITEFSDSNFQELVKKIDEFLEANNQIRIPKAVRLAFHDCISGCNGCINGKNPDNLGLKGIVKDSFELEAFIKDKLFYNLSLSRADLWILIAFRAIYISANHPGLTQPILNFKFGRVNCAEGALLDELEILPSSVGNWGRVQGTFQKFNFTNREIIALMGAHSLGGAKTNISGFEGWFNKNLTIFDNSYFKNLMNKTLDYKNVAIGEKYQWNSTYDRCTSEFNDRKCKIIAGPKARMMLNTDMCLYKDFQADEKGKASCDYKTCGLNLDTANFVEEFATYEVEFKKAFGDVFVKMAEFGYSQTSCGLKDPINPCKNLR